MIEIGPNLSFAIVASAAVFAVAIVISRIIGIFIWSSMR
jgi:hypothetical protein